MNPEIVRLFQTSCITLDSDRISKKLCEIVIIKTIHYYYYYYYRNYISYP